MTEMTEPEGYHYAVIARALRLIDAEGGTAMPLDDLARALNMSPAHFQRVFTRWVGVSPKRYQQYLTLDLAKRLLEERHTVLDAADGAGLSGGGRLHDLFIRWEAMSPGEFARAGEGLRIHWGWSDSPFGPALLMATDRGICGIGFAAETGAEATMADLLGRWPKADFVEDPMMLRPLALSAFGASADPAPVFAIGAPFQIKVWEALLAIPSGHVTTYTDLATAIGNPRAVRAVGTAVGRNPVSWLIPCHRALRKTGELGGYHWGLPIKRALLAWEAARSDAG
ncbi:DNA-O6-methylguanine--protein-cysteine S-methyltransferase /transcriptional regulator Ada [Defluviimonas denitrificans]|jgi:AraC family transcriptional regulator of adaptative response/methylated-DNA-[protein]-cysteine methyltransferase|uniref:methylated-DNA--[protein]-cysteine S-methyltransferase n=2 Tax=Albidovulum denitrificans TaxID=404881 RepID=A0A2S8S800_9RHOB|nr:DNA-O6-methylguanine--protein-cysteine S-methyltransferase /transcriptional regulator Ada [Defluviimonas denitrificans]